MDERGVVFTACLVVKDGRDLLRMTMPGRGRHDHCIHPAFVEFVASFLYGRRRSPSTGMLATFFLLNVCRTQLDLYGFAFANTTAPNHYYDSAKRRSQAHNFGREETILKRLQQLDMLGLVE